MTRTGSTLLSEALTAASAGRVKEYFSPMLQYPNALREIIGNSNCVEQIDKILEAGTSPNGIFGAKIHWPVMRHIGLVLNGQWHPEQRFAAYRLLRAQPDLLPVDAACDLLRDFFSGENWRRDVHDFLNTHIPGLRYVWVRRKNMIARAISEVRALHTGQWYLPSRTDAKPTVDSAPEFDFGEIHIRHCIGIFFEAQWPRFFDEFKLDFHNVTYEELVADYEKTVRDVLTYLEVRSSEMPMAAPTSARQSDATSGDWEARYRVLAAERGNGWAVGLD